MVRIVRSQKYVLNHFNISESFCVDFVLNKEKRKTQDKIHVFNKTEKCVQLRTDYTTVF